MSSRKQQASLIQMWSSSKKCSYLIPIIFSDLFKFVYDDVAIPSLLYLSLAMHVCFEVLVCFVTLSCAATYCVIIILIFHCNLIIRYACN